MSNTYLVRAKLDYKWTAQGGSPTKLPLTIGPFTIKDSPNADLYLYGREHELSNGQQLPAENKDYPFSLYYVDTKIQVPNGLPYKEADNKLSQLESLFRLFQPGWIYIRRHEVWKIKGGKKTDVWIVDPRGFLEVRPKPESALSYDMLGYDMSDGKLDEFKHFFELYFGIIDSKRQPLNIAVARFNSSYDKRTLADRLIDLMIAMEALLGSQTEVSYKIALRFSCLIYPRGEARAKGFKAVKEVYDKRSAILHGESLKKPLNEVDVANFEANVRMLIINILKLCKSGTLLMDLKERKDWEKSLDKFLFFEGSKSNG